MITLKHLHIERFKALQTVDLHFPEKGGILVEGHNEAGKSTLFEALYVALYGVPLVGENTRPKLEEVVQYGAASAVVELTLCLDSREVMIRRELYRDKQPRASMTITTADEQVEKTTGIRAVNERVLQEIGNLDRESLQNSCFVQQDDLGRLENLTRAEREQAMEKLLGLERFSHLKKRFKLSPELRQELSRAHFMLALALCNEKLGEWYHRRDETAERLAAIQIVRHVGEAEDAARGLASAQKQVCESKERENEARSLIARHDALVALQAKVVDIQTAGRNVSAMREPLAEDLATIAGLERLETQEIPRLTNRLARIDDVLAAVTAVDEAETRIQHAVSLVTRAQNLVTELGRTTTEHERARASLTEAENRAAQRRYAADVRRHEDEAALASLRDQRARLDGILDAAIGWEKAQGTVNALDEVMKGVDARTERLVSARTARAQAERDDVAARTAAQEAQDAAAAMQEALTSEARRDALATWCAIVRAAREAETRGQTRDAVGRDLAAAEMHENTFAATLRSRRLGAAGAAGAGVLALVAGLAVTFVLLVVGVLLLGAGAALFMQSRALETDVTAARGQRQVLETKARDLDVAAQAAAMGDGRPTLSEQEAALARLGVPVPSSLEEGEQRLEQARALVPTGASASIAARHTDLVQEAGRLRGIAQTTADLLMRAQAAAEVAEQAAAADDRPARVAELARARSTADEAAKAARVAAGDVLDWPFTSRDVSQKIDALDTLIADAERRQIDDEAQGAARIAEADGDVRAGRAEVERTKAARDAAHGAVAAEPLDAATASLDATRAAAARLRGEAATLASAHELPSDRTSLISERGGVEERLKVSRWELARRPQIEGAIEAQQHDIETTLTTIEADLTALRAGLASLDHEGEAPQDGVAETVARPGARHEHDIVAAVTVLKGCISDLLAPLDAVQLGASLETILSNKAARERDAETFAEALRDARDHVGALLREQGLSLPTGGVQLRDGVHSIWPLTLAVHPHDLDGTLAEQEQTGKEIFAAEQERERLHAELGYPDAVPSPEECRRTVADLEEQKAVCAYALQIVDEARGRIMRSVLPTTERNMSLLLPQLTAQRYWDVRLTPPAGEPSGPDDLDYRIRVWDPDAQRYLAKNIFSGGTRDQCSLALRLSFALATLPQERGVAPGFIFLDEPLSAFDAQRARDLVALLTTGTIAQQFAQVIVVSHANAFDRTSFPYHVVMEEGRVKESDLPTPAL